MGKHNLIDNQFTFSKFARSVDIKYDIHDAIKYLYFNSKLHINASRDEFMRAMRPSTVCNHIRMMHAYTWFKDENYFHLILDAISECKLAVSLLRYAKHDPKFDKGWWQFKKYEIYKKSDSRDTFLSSVEPKYVSADFYLDEQKIAEKICAYPASELPIVFQNFKEMLELLNGLKISKSDKEFVKLLILTAVYQRYRIDRRIIFHEEKGQA